jgi:hypothetical protein
MPTYNGFKNNQNFSIKQPQLYIFVINILLLKHKGVKKNFDIPLSVDKFAIVSIN